jgi:aminoglycoside phosphotransferase (APT) family kinase protein
LVDSPVVTGDDFDGGWDNRAVLVEGRWVDRTPRFPDREPQLRREAGLLPWLAPLVPLPVPVPEVVSEEPLTVRHAYLPGGPCPGTSAAQGAAVGAFLRVLHRVDPDEAVRHGAPDPIAYHAEMLATLDHLRRRVLPLLPERLLAAGEALLSRMAVAPGDPRLVHGDLGPEHIRVTGEQVTGIIDWGDSGVGDPAIDLAWTVFGAAPAFAEAVLSAYDPPADVLAPWHEVLYGLGSGGPAFVTSGLAGTVDRLKRLGGA